MARKAIFLFFCAALLARLGFADEYFIDPINGDDSASGSISSPWKTVGASIDRLSPGDVLILRGGIYNEESIKVSNSGMPSAWITIKNYPGENPVIDGSYPEFRTAGNSAWELYDASLNIYRSVNTYSEPSVAVYGAFGPDNGSWKLVPYESYGPMATNNENYSDDGLFYCGPGTYYDSTEQKIYVRLTQSIYQTNHPDGNTYDFPSGGETDPRQLPLYIYPDKAMFDFVGTAGYFEFDGVDLKHMDNLLETDSTFTGLTVKNSTLVGGRYCIRFRNSIGLTVDNVQFPFKFPPWVSRADVKYPTPGRPAHLFQGAGIELKGTSSNIEIMNSTFTDCFDAIDPTDEPINMRIHDNMFDNIRDDVLQLGSAAYDVEIYDNVMIRVKSSISWNGSGGPSSTNRGKVYIHHNIIDTRELSLVGREDPNNQLDDKFLGPNGDNMATNRPFGSHNTDLITGGAPWKIYHNTTLFAEDNNNRGSGAPYDISAFDPNTPHEVYNNIFVQSSDYWLMREQRVADGSQIFDGNLYFRSSATSIYEFFFRVMDSEGGATTDYYSLAEFLASQDYQDSKAYYAPGWENSGVQGDPELDSNYIPSATGPAASGAIDLSPKGWPGLYNETFRGAKPPAPVPQTNHLRVASNTAILGNDNVIVPIELDIDSDLSSIAFTIEVSDFMASGLEIREARSAGRTSGQIQEGGIDNILGTAVFSIADFTGGTVISADSGIIGEIVFDATDAIEGDYLLKIMDINNVFDTELNEISASIGADDGSLSILPFLLGDVDNNQILQALDAILIFRTATRLSPKPPSLTNPNLPSNDEIAGFVAQRGDYYQDNEINFLDALDLFREATGLPPRETHIAARIGGATRHNFSTDRSLSLGTIETPVGSDSVVVPIVLETDVNITSIAFGISVESDKGQDIQIKEIRSAGRTIGQLQEGALDSSGTSATFAMADFSGGTVIPAGNGMIGELVLGTGQTAAADTIELSVSNLNNAYDTNLNNITDSIMALNAKLQNPKGISNAETGLPNQYRLFSNYPNPFNPETTIRYGLPVESHVTVEIFNLNGQIVSVLVDKFQSAGFYEIQWVARDSNGNPVPSGLYVVRMKGNGHRNTMKILLLK